MESLSQCGNGLSAIKNGNHESQKKVKGGGGGAKTRSDKSSRYAEPGSLVRVPEKDVVALLESGQIKPEPKVFDVRALQAAQKVTDARDKIEDITQKAELKGKEAFGRRNDGIWDRADTMSLRDALTMNSSQANSRAILGELSNMTGWYGGTIGAVGKRFYGKNAEPMRQVLGTIIRETYRKMDTPAKARFLKQSDSKELREILNY